MRILRFEAYLFLIYETFFYLTIGQTINKEKSDCTILYNYINGDSKDYANICCSSFEYPVDCDDEGYITIFSTSFNMPDLTSFPYLSRIEHLYIENNDLTEIQDNILKLTSLKTFVIDNNNLKEFPKEVYKLKNLVTLSLSNNKIKVIPPDIQNLTSLISLYIDGNDIKELPNEIYNLPNLERLTLDNNRKLNVKIVNFNKLIVICEFANINILCYEPNTCERIYTKDQTFSDAEAQKIYKACTKEEIDEIISHKKNKKNFDNKENSSNLSHNESKSSIIQNANENNYNNKEKSTLPFIDKIGIVLIFIVSISIGIFCTSMFSKKNKSIKHNKSYYNLDDEIGNESIINNSQIRNNSFNVNNEINNPNNNNSYINGSTQNNINKNKNIMANLNDVIQEIYQDDSHSSHSFSF